MKLIKTPIVTKSPKNSYHIKIEYTHGDADSETFHTHKLDNKSEEQVIKFITRLQEIIKSVSENRHYGSKLPEDISDSSVEVDDMRIYLELDHHYNTGPEDYYAGMSIKEFKYYDDNGNAFKIDIKN